MAKHVISTLSADNRYTKWQTNHGAHTVERSVLVKGGAAVATMGSGDVVTHGAVRTQVSDDDAKFLSEHDLFKEHQARGFVKIVNVAKDPEVVAPSMTKDEGSRPKTPADVKEYAKKKGAKDDGTELQAVINK